MCAFLSSYSQSLSKKKSQEPSNAFDDMQKDVVVFKSNPCVDCTSFAFSNIKIIDRRYDTSSFGYMISYKGFRKNCKLVTQNVLKNDLENCLNDVYKNNLVPNGSSLIIVLRKFWVYGIYSSEEKWRSSGTKVNYALKAGIDFFLLSDSLYVPLIRRDTSLPFYETGRVSERGTSMISTLKDFLKSLSIDSVISQVSHRKKLNYQELNEYYDKYFNKPVIHDSELKKGVYMTFDEFKNNAPAYSNFEVRNTKLADDIYLIHGKDTSLTRTVWGYCDGKNRYIKSGTNLFLLNKYENGFSFIGCMKLTYVDYVGLSVPAIATSNPTINIIELGLRALTTPQNKFKLNLVPLYLDMESGEIY